MVYTVLAWTSAHVFSSFACWFVCQHTLEGTSPRGNRFKFGAIMIRIWIINYGIASDDCFSFENRNSRSKFVHKFVFPPFRRHRWKHHLMTPLLTWRGSVQLSMCPFATTVHCVKPVVRARCHLAVTLEGHQVTYRGVMFPHGKWTLGVEISGQKLHCKSQVAVKSITPTD